MTVVEFISRKDLGWPASAAPLKTHATRGVKVHYEGTHSPVRDHKYCKSYWTGIRNSHLANTKEGYSDVAYNYAVCRHGAVLEGRGLGRRTGANGNQALNADHDSVVVLYGTNDSSVSSGVVAGVRWVIQYLRDHGTDAEILGHRDGYATACPGEPLYALVKSGKFEPQKEVEDLTPAQDELLKKIYSSLAIKPWGYKNEKLAAAAEKAGKSYPDMHQRVSNIEAALKRIEAKLK